jgi:chromosome segregation ATPase
MSLVVTRQGKPDTRMIEYDQAVVRLGIEKAEAENDLAKIRYETAEIGTQKAKFFDEIAVAKKELEIVKNQITDAAVKGTEKMSQLLRENQKLESRITEKTESVQFLNDSLCELEDNIALVRASFESVSERLNDVKKKVNEANIELDNILLKKHQLERDIFELEGKKKEFQEFVDASENFLSYFSEKEQFLNRKEADLLKYEKQLEKKRKDIGNNNEMKFQ